MGCFFQVPNASRMRKLKNSELGRLSIPEFKQAGKLPVTVILDNVRSLYNIGSVFRSSDAFLIERICLCGITACPPHRDIRKTALGATESVDWTYYRETTAAVDELKTSGYRIIAVEQTDAGIPMNEFKASRTEKYAIIFGHEIRGVEQEIVDMADVRGV